MGCEESKVYCNHFIPDDYVYTVEGKITSVRNINTQIICLTISDRYRNFYFKGTSKIKVNDDVKIEYRLFKSCNHVQAWITNIHYKKNDP
jgi:hypothetical protein